MLKPKVYEYGTTTYGRNRMSAESAHFPTFGTKIEPEIRSTYPKGSNAYEMENRGLPVTVLWFFGIPWAS